MSRKKYTIEKTTAANTYGEIKSFWKISYMEYGTKYTIPANFFTKKEAQEEIKRIS